MNHESIDNVFEWEEDIGNGIPSIIGKALVNNDGDGVPEQYDIMFAQVAMVGALRSVTTTSVDAGYALKMKVGRVTAMRSDKVADDPFDWSEGYDDAMMFHSVREAVAHAEEVYYEYTELQKTRGEQVERMLVSAGGC